MEATKDYRAYATKAITPTMEAFGDFLLAEVYGGTLPAGVSEEDFRRGVALGGSLRMDFQRSDFWKSDERNYLANVDARRAVKAEETLRKAEAARTKLAARIAKAEAALEAARKAAGSEEDAEILAGEDGGEAARIDADEEAAREEAVESAPAPRRGRRNAA